MIEKPYEGRAKIEYDGIFLTIRIPAKKNWFMILFLAAWLGGWFMGETSAFSELFSNKNVGVNAFMLFWLIGWSIGGLFALTVIVWSLLGQETIVIQSGIFNLSKGLLNIQLFKKSYDSNSIKNLELIPEQTLSESFFEQKKKIGDFWGITGGRLKFDYGMKTIKFGLGLDDAEARYLIDQIKKHGFYKDK